MKLLYLPDDLKDLQILLGEKWIQSVGLTICSNLSDVQRILEGKGEEVHPNDRVVLVYPANELRNNGKSIRLPEGFLSKVCIFDIKGEVVRIFGEKQAREFSGIYESIPRISDIRGSLEG